MPVRIWTGNLRSMLMEIALLAGYQYEDSGWIAVEHNMEEPAAQP